MKTFFRLFCAGVVFMQVFIPAVYAEPAETPADGLSAAPGLAEKIENMVAANGTGAILDFLSPETAAAAQTFRLLADSELSLQKQRLQSQQSLLRALCRARAALFAQPGAADTAALGDFQNALDRVLAQFSDGAAGTDVSAEQLDAAFDAFWQCAAGDFARLPDGAFDTLRNALCALPFPGDFPAGAASLVAAVRQTSGAEDSAVAPLLCLLTCRDYLFICRTVSRLGVAAAPVLSADIMRTLAPLTALYAAGDILPLLPLLPEYVLAQLCLQPCSGGQLDRLNAAWQKAVPFLLAADSALIAELMSWQVHAWPLLRLSLLLDSVALFMPSSADLPAGEIAALRSLLSAAPVTTCPRFTFSTKESAQESFMQKTSGERNALFAKAAFLQKQAAFFVANDELPADMILQGATAATYPRMISDYVFSDCGLSFVVAQSERFSWFRQFCSPTESAPHIPFSDTETFPAAAAVAALELRARQLSAVCRKNGFALERLCTPPEIQLVKMMTGKLPGYVSYSLCGTSPQILNDLLVRWDMLLDTVESSAGFVRADAVRVK